jgi:tetratricopeptide (TPR) repeat protein
VVDDLISHPLTSARLRQGWTLADTAAVVQQRSGVNMACRREKVWRWEHGVTPEPAAQHALAGALGLEPDVVEMHPWPRWLLLVGPAEPVGGPWVAQTTRDVLTSVAESAPVDRRGFLLLSATGLARNWSSAEAARLPDLDEARVSGEAVDHLQARVEELWRLDDALGGDRCLEAGAADLRLVERLIRRAGYSAEVGPRLYSLAAAMARFCGWAAFDAGREAAAQRYWHAGLRAAAAAGDVDQGVYLLSNLALQAAYAGDGLEAVALLDVARRHVDPAARTVLAMVDCWAVRGLAAAGNAKAAASTLNRADDRWDRRRPEDDPDWVYWMPQPSLTAEAGTALLDIGDVDAAERSLTAGLSTLDGDAVRDRNLYLVRLAEVRLRTGRLDEATATAREAVTAAAELDSTRVRRQVGHLLDQLPAAEPRTAELCEYARSVL